MTTTPVSRPLSILLVDDDPNDRDLVKLELSREFEDVQFQEAGTSETLKQALERGGFDIALIDYRLGWSDGLQVMSEVRGKYPDEPVIMFTGSGDEDVGQRAMNLGAADYVVKSMRHRARLVVALQRALQQVREREALRRTERLATVGQMMGALAHEINNPLDAVSQLLYLIARQPDAPQEIRDYAKIAEAELARAAEITKKTLGFVRESPSDQPVQLKEIVDDVLTLLAKRFQQNNVRVIRDYSPVEVRGSATELRQVIMNILANAAEAMERGGGTLRVRIRTRAGRSASDASVVLLICDTGPGIPRSTQRHIMRPFFTTKGSRGTGLGLWISSDIVQKHGGSLRFRSTTDKHRSGTCFRITLPHSRFQRTGESTGAAN
jgi:signal transduction histidine kinase